jgi:hypothetical protein
MSATTVPSQAVPWRKRNPTRDQSHADMAAWFDRTLEASRVRGLSVEHAAYQPRIRRAADRGHRQLRAVTLWVRSAAPLRRLDRHGQGAAPGFGGDQVAAAPIAASNGS